MDRQYCKSIFEYLLSKKQEGDYTFNVLLNEENLTKKLTKDCSLFPCVIINGGYEYSTNNIQNYCLDFSKVIPASFRPSITILTDNISDMVEIEKQITLWLEDSIRLKTEQPNNAIEEFSYDISIDKSVKIDRSNKDFTYSDGTHTIYQAIIQLKSSNDVVIFMYDYHPAEIEFDKNVQFELVKRGKALEELLKQADTFSDEHAQQIHTGYNAVLGLLGIVSFDGYGFRELYKVMSDQNCDIKTASEECSRVAVIQAQRVEEKAKQIAEEQQKEAQRKQAEIQRIKHINELFTNIGDPAVNRYIDKIVDDIKCRVSLPFSFQIYVGTTAMEWYRKRELKQLDNTSIVINDTIKFSQKSKTYTANDNNGTKNTFAFTTDILPISLGFNICIYSKSIQERNAVKEALISQYKKSVPISVLLPNGNTYYISIMFEEDNQAHYKTIQNNLGLNFGGMRISANGGFTQANAQTDEKPNEYGYYTETLHFKRCQAIYFLDDLDNVELKNNHKLQIDFLYLAEFYGQVAVKLNEVSKKLGGNYLYLVQEPLTLYQKLNSHTLKDLKECYINKRPLDREKFNSLFVEILEIYPYLYEKTINGWTFDQVKADILKYYELFDNRFISVYTALEIPQKFKRVSGVPFAFDCLRAYAISMSSDYNITIQDAIATKEENLLETIKWEQEERASMSYQRSNDYDSSSSSGGHGILSGIYRSVSSGSRNRGNDTPKKSSGKQSLWGTAMCPWGKKNESGFTIRCNIGCPMWTQCGGK